MSLSSDSAVLTMPVQPANNSYNNGCNGWGGDWMGWIVLFLIFGMFGWGGMGGFGWGGGMGGASPYMTSAVTQSDLQRGFDNQSVMNKLNGLESGLCDGFYAMNTGMLQGFNGVQQGLNGVTNAMQQGFNSTNFRSCKITHTHPSPSNIMREKNKKWRRKNLRHSTKFSLISFSTGAW